MDTNLTSSKKTKNRIIFIITFLSFLVMILAFNTVMVCRKVDKQGTVKDLNSNIYDILNSISNLENSESTDDYSQVINQCVNLEFYYETEDASKPITNVKGVSKEEFLESTKKYYENYALISGKNIGKNEEKSQYGINLSSGKETGYDRYIRIRNKLSEGDSIYDQLQKLYEGTKIININIIALVASTILLIISIIAFKKGKYDGWDNNCIVDIYSKIFLEVRATIILTVLSLLSDLWNIDDITITSICIISLSLVFTSFLYNIIYKYNIELQYGKKYKNNSIICRIVYFFINKFREIIKYIIEATSVQTTMFQTTFIVTILVIYNIYMAFFINIILNHRDWFFIKWMLICGAIVGLYGIFKAILNVAVNVNKIKDITDSIVQGNYNSNIKVETEGTIKMIADNLENIENGLNEAVSKAITSEKMKSELITNVSHDLKTPLTSIINYVDLLSKDGISEEERVKYLSVLNKKSQRLKVLIENLFEVSKATSGTIELNMQSIDPVALLRQTIGEFEDKIETSDLKFIKKLPEEKVMIYADGKRTFRVFQNLISNILKYSLKGSRVYIEIKEIQDYIEISFKNISEYELNFTATEIVERFKRGDLSRTTEGSGLGLAIAKSLVEIQGGQFEIIIDGDLFKVLVRFKKENINS